MFKKIAIAALAVAAGLFILNSTRFGSYAKTAWGKARACLERQVTPEFELDNLRRQVGELGPDMRKHINAIAAESVAVQNLKTEITQVRTNLERQKENIRVMNEDLKSGNQRIRYGDMTYSRERIKAKLARDLVSCKRCADELKAKEALLEAKEEALQSAKEQLESMKQQKEDLEVQIAQMEAELRAVRVAQTRSNFKLDDSRLGQIKESLKNLRTRIDTERKEAELMADFVKDIPVEKKVKSAEDLSKEVEAFLSDSSKSDDKIADNK